MPPTVADEDLVTAYQNLSGANLDPVSVAEMLWGANSESFSATEICATIHPKRDDDSIVQTTDPVVFAVVKALYPEPGLEPEATIDFYCEKREITNNEAKNAVKGTVENGGQEEGHVKGNENQKTSMNILVVVHFPSRSHRASYLDRWTTDDLDKMIMRAVYGEQGQEWRRTYSPINIFYYSVYRYETDQAAAAWARMFPEDIKSSDEH